MRFNIDHVEESFKGQCVHVAISNVGFLHHYRHWKNSIYDKLAVDELTKYYQRSSAKKSLMKSYLYCNVSKMPHS